MGRRHSQNEALICNETMNHEKNLLRLPSRAAGPGDDHGRGHDGLKQPAFHGFKRFRLD